MKPASLLTLFALTVFLPASAQAQHSVDGVDLPDIIRIVDDSIPGFTPIVMTWDGTTGMWSSASGQSPVYHLRPWNDENGDQYVVGVDYPNGGTIDAASLIVSKPGVKPLVFYKKFPQFPISYYYAFLFMDATLPFPPLPPSTYTVQ